MENESQLTTQETNQTQADYVKKIELNPIIVNSKNFDINLVCNSFVRSIYDKSSIDIILYLQGFSELNK